MNTIDNWITTATITNPERKEFWIKVFDSDCVPIKSILNSRANVPGHFGIDVYMLDLDAINTEQRQKLIKALADKFDLEISEVECHLDDLGVPIIADDVVVSSSDQGVFFSMIDDPFDGDHFEDEFLFDDYPFDDLN